MVSARERALIVGGGQAGGWIAKTLRSEGFAGRITVVGEEIHPPYERPPLSKAVLLSAEAIGETVLLSSGQAAALDIELTLGKRVTALDRAARVARCADGDAMSYDMLFLTMGSRPRVPDWMIEDDRIHLLRTLDDAARLREGLRSTRRLLVIGGGWIGLETAATARAMGIDVIVVQATDAVCSRSLPPAVSQWLLHLHQQRGVRFCLRETVQSVRVAGGQVEIELASGLHLSGDRLVVGIGNLPNSELAAAAGLATNDGIMVDQVGRTDDDRIFAAGDVAAFPCTFARKTVRRESWANAQNQAIAVARTAMGLDATYEQLPWLWSDQYGINIQIAGLPEEGTRTVFKAGPGEDGGSWLALDECGLPVGAVSAADPHGFRPLRKALQARSAVDLDGWAEISSSGD